MPGAETDSVHGLQSEEMHWCSYGQTPGTELRHTAATLVTHCVSTLQRRHNAEHSWHLPTAQADAEPVWADPHIPATGMSIVHVSSTRPHRVAPARLCWTPVDDSPWTTNSIAGLCCSTACVSCSRLYPWPADASMLTTFAPYRSARSHTRAPQMPAAYK